MPALRRILAAIVLTAALWASAGAAAADTPTTPTGKWAGTVSWFVIYGPGESYDRARMTLTFKGKQAALVASGTTAASHDPPSATATCASSFRLVGEQDGWLVYRQFANGPAKGDGGVFAGPCTIRRADEAGVLRVRTAGKRLKAEVGWTFRKDPPRWEYRSYLSRA